MAQFRDLHGIAADSNGNIYVSDDVYIRKVTPAGYVTTLAGSVRGYLDAFGTGAQVWGRDAGSSCALLEYSVSV